MRSNGRDFSEEKLSSSSNGHSENLNKLPGPRLACLNSAVHLFGCLFLTSGSKLFSSWFCRSQTRQKYRDLNDFENPPKNSNKYFMNYEAKILSAKVLYKIK